MREFFTQKKKKKKSLNSEFLLNLTAQWLDLEFQKGLRNTVLKAHFP